MRQITLAVLTAAAIALACGKGGDSSLAPGGVAGLASCTAGQQPFSVIPVDPSRITGWVPLGNLNPPAHTFPTDHQYLYLTYTLGSPTADATLLAPGDVYVVYAKVDKAGDSLGGKYAITFQPCQQLRAEFGHVRSFSSTLLQQLGAFDQNCQTYSPAPGQTATQCYTKQVSIKLKAGDVIGTAGGLDLNLYDSRAAPLAFANSARWQTSPDGFDRFHAVPFSDYYAEPARTTVRALLGLYDGSVRRTTEPRGGSIAVDIAGTVQGNWFNASQPSQPESPHLSIVPDNVDPTMVDLSIGTSQPGFSTSVYRMFPSASGDANKAPSLITPGATVYCYDVRYYFGFMQFARMLLQLTDATTLVAEVQTSTGNCAASTPWVFTAGKAFTYRR